MDEVRASGLIVTDKRRAFPRDVPPNDNPPVGSVGPNVPAGFGDTHVNYPAAWPPIEAQAWQGWPVEWATPTFGAFVGLDTIYGRSSVVWGALDLNASVCASFPVYTTSNGVPTTLPAWTYNPEPALYTSWYEFFKQVFISYMLGEVIIYATARYREGKYEGLPSRFVMLNPQAVSIEFDGDGQRRYSIGGPSGEEITEDVLHVRYVSWPGDARGHGPLEACTASLFGALALERYATNLAQRGGVPWAVLTHPGNLSGAQAGDLQTAFVSSRQSSIGAPAVLSGGITLQQLTLSPRDMALLELRGFDEARLSVLLGVPPFLLGLPTGADSLTYSTTESLYDFWWRSSLRPKMAALGSALSEWLRPVGERVEFNRDELTQPGFNERATGYSTLFNIYDPATGKRAIEVEEIRQRERFGATQTVGAPAQVALTSTT